MRNTGTVHQLFARERCAGQAQSLRAWLKQLLPAIAAKDPEIARRIDMTRFSHCAILFELFKAGNTISQAAASPTLATTRWVTLP